MYVSTLVRLQYYRDWFEVDQSCFVESNMLSNVTSVADHYAVLLPALDRG